MKIKKRVSPKKRAAEPEEIQSILQDVFSRVRQTFGEYRRVALLSISILIILGIITIVYYSLSLKRDRNVSTLEYRAYNSFIEGDYHNALSTYQEIAGKYSSSTNIPIILYYVGNSYLGLGQPDEAIESYNKFIEKYQGQTTILPLVYINLGHAYINKKDYNSAISAFKKASTTGNSLIVDRAVYEMAKAYEVSGDSISAIEQYEYLSKTYPASPWSQEISGKLNKSQEDSISEQSIVNGE